MSKFQFSDVEATRRSILLRAALCGPSGSGKTYTALSLGSRLVQRLGCGPLYVVDSESGSALRYAPNRAGAGFAFRHVRLPEDDYSPAVYMAALDFCESKGAGVVVIDSLSHAWNGIGGVLELVDQKTNESRSKNAFATGWREMTPLHNRMIQRILSSSAHVIFTLRAKVDWVMQEGDRGKREPVKVGLAPVQRDGIDYEPDLFFDMTVPDNNLVVTKSRCDRLAPGEVFRKPGLDFADVLADWIADGEAPSGPRTLGEATERAVAAGLRARQAKDGEAYKSALTELRAWAAERGICSDRIEAAASMVKARVQEGGAT